MRHARAVDPLGHRVHIALAMLYVLLATLTTAPKDIAFVALLVCAVVRLAFGPTARCYAGLLRDRLWWLVLAWGLWHGLTILWSPDRPQGLDELRAFRFVLTAFALWPVLGQTVWLITAFLVGVALQNGVQLMQQLHWLGFEPGANERLRGLIHPIQTGTVCTIALCWHVALMLRGGPRLAILGTLGGVLAGLGLVMAGSRGPWIAAALALTLMVPVTVARRPGSRRRGLVLTGVAILTLAAAWPLAGGMVSARVRQAREDLHFAAQGQYATDTGLRIASWIAAWRMARSAPLGGSGAGGFQRGAEEAGLANYLREAEHAHSMYMHALGCTGAVGLLLVGGVVAVSVGRAFRDPPNHPFVDGTPFALLSWYIGAVFDAYQLAGQMMAVLMFLLVLSVPGRPPPARC
jgi:O-antigen ligase